MKTFITISSLLLIIASPAGAADTQPVATLNLIPWPAQVTRNAGQFTIGAETRVVAEPGFKAEGEQLAAALTLPSGAGGTGIVLKKSDNLPAEGYTLDVTADGVTIAATTPAGAFYGCQTLRQLASGHAIPCVSIVDSPRIAWRGLSLDVARHFYDKAEVEAVLDQMAQLKLNALHWHLTDDEGWRIEIKKYPKLTSFSAWRAITNVEKGSPHIVDGRYGGFYTQDDIREIVAYAAVRHIRIVPEVDMPGHMSAAAAAYPEMSPDNGWTPIVGLLVKGERCAALCVGREKTLQFCKDVLAELLPLFPSKEIHIGGDEVFYEQWEPCPDMQALKKKLNAKDWEEVQVWFGNQISAYLQEHGRTAIFWNNIYRQTVDKRSINQFWRAPMNHARDFANAGYDVLISDSNYYYFDHHPPLEKAYLNDPVAIPGLTAEGKPRVLGVVSCAWTERIPAFAKLQSELYPRLIAHAESDWTAQERKDWASFQTRLAQFKFAGKE